MSAGEPVLRPAGPADLAALVVVWRRAVVATHDFLAPGDVDRYEGVVRAGLPTLTVTLAERQGRVLGFVAVAGSRVEMLFVDPDVHGSGVGSALLRHVTAGRPVVDLDVNEQNPGARAFYARRGFVEVGRSPLDGDGRPYPLLHLRRRAPADGARATPADGPGAAGPAAAPEA
ncbi:GNAT family N-acetyltransferase [Cellulomonas sp. ACRRI]|uniref:GNAT family N-acetyltransferase n=1 Tax=Cellulomonas sp. ACRRI TaxID=2918188 RepID=UPI001EF19266|nr:GNAT family N-acetyltransferase [Cellulomonas sp. ACRRI]MCG7285002.1 GNAT family N-acetyltransferase [Cellulomonas sp. ACRRI]